MVLRFESGISLAIISISSLIEKSDSIIMEFFCIRDFGSSVVRVGDWIQFHYSILHVDAPRHVLIRSQSGGFE